MTTETTQQGGNGAATTGAQAAQQQGAPYDPAWSQAEIRRATADRDTARADAKAAREQADKLTQQLTSLQAVTADRDKADGAELAELRARLPEPIRDVVPESLPVHEQLRGVRKLAANWTPPPAPGAPAAVPVAAPAATSAPAPAPTAGPAVGQVRPAVATGSTVEEQIATLAAAGDKAGTQAALKKVKAERGQVGLMRVLENIAKTYR